LVYDSCCDQVLNRKSRLDHVADQDAVMEFGVNACAGGGSKDSLTSGATERTTPVIRVTGLDEIVDNYDTINTADQDSTDQGK